MAPPFALLGPPSVSSHYHASLTTAHSNLEEDPSSLIVKPQKNPCLDLFFSELSTQNLHSLLENSWSHDPLSTFKYIFSLRNIGGFDDHKPNNNEAFLSALLWLHQSHPLTLALNLTIFSDLGCLRDLLLIFLRILVGCPQNSPNDNEVEIKRTNRVRESFIVVMQRERPSTGEEISIRRRNYIGAAKKALEKYSKDANYRFLHNQIANLFAQLLQSDLQFLSSGDIEMISFASKMCPSPDSAYDKSTLICEAIARKLFPRESHVEYRDIEERHYAYRIRDRLRKQVLVPLRKALEGPNRLNSLAIGKPQKRFFKKNDIMLYRAYKMYYGNVFTSDDDQRFSAYLDIANRRGNKRKVLFPHKIMSCLNDQSELRWRNMVEDWIKKWKWGNCLSTFNVSENANCTQTAVNFAIGMTLLVSELSPEPWKGKVITYSTEPKLCTIEGDDLSSKVEFLKKMDRAETIRFSKVFDEILNVAITEKVSEEQMLKRVFVMTDMDFEKTTNHFWGMWASLARYKNVGHMMLPEIIFWDMKETLSAPEISKRNGLIIIRGFSETWASTLLERGVVLEPGEVMKLVPKPESLFNSAICRKQFDNLLVFD